MRNSSAIAVLFAALTAHAEPLDRIAVTVGGRVITESAILLDLRVDAFLDRVPVDMSAAAKRRSAERLTDQILILREATESHFSLPADASSMIEDLRTQYGSDYQPALVRYGIKESDVAAHLLSGLIGLVFTDLRFRPAVQISDEDMRAYHASLKVQESFEDSREKIEDIMRRQRTTEALDQWLVTARAAARVQFREAVFQ